MSQDTRENLKQLTNTLFKIGLGVAAYVMVTIFTDMRDSMKQLTNDVSNVKERISRMEGRLEKN